MRVSVIIFPGSNCDMDAIHAFRNVLGAEVTPVWHKDQDLSKPDLVFIPGGFSYGDYLRSGAIARLSPVMSSVQDFYNKGGFVFGVCNGFQILCEMGILPGALLTNKNLKFLCQDVHIRVVNTDTPFSNELEAGRVLNIPIAHGMGQYFADDATLDRLEDEGRVLFRYCEADGSLSEAANPNGSMRSIAGICDADRRALGMMPHPERHVESELGSDDGRALLSCIVDHFGASV
jgi:phosphoribosylformylglycinamidine synthase